MTQGKITHNWNEIKSHFPVVIFSFFSVGKTPGSWPWCWLRLWTGRAPSAKRTPRPWPCRSTGRTAKPTWPSESSSTSSRQPHPPSSFMCLLLSQYSNLNLSIPIIYKPSHHSSYKAFNNQWFLKVQKSYWKGIILLPSKCILISYSISFVLCNILLMCYPLTIQPKSIK